MPCTAGSGERTHENRWSRWLRREVDFSECERLGEDESVAAFATEAEAVRAEEVAGVFAVLVGPGFGP